MPELPEVEIITQGLRKQIVGWTIAGIWTDWPKYFKISGGFKKVEQILLGKKILSIARRGKNILFYLAGDYLLVIHLKLTGLFLFSIPAAYRHAHIVFDLKRGSAKSKLYFSDVRKFAKILVGKTDVVISRPEIAKLGPDPLEISFREFAARTKKRRGKIKTVLLNQNFLAGVGNIYSDEALYLAKIHPLSLIEKLPKDKLKILFQKLIWVLKKSLKLKGSTRQDYRDLSGAKGNYFNQRLVYARKGEKCRCGGVITTTRIGSRTSHFCSKCQELYF